MTPADEADAVRERYARRTKLDPRYSLFDVAAMLAWQERQREVLRLLKTLGLTDLPALRLLDVGCGAGANLLDCLRLGFAADRLAGIDLLPERIAAARACLPAAVDLRVGDAAAMRFDAGGFDIVFQATVFSSLLDDAFQQRLADAMWRSVAPGGGVLWYDFTVDNPRNPDVRGVPLRRLRKLFPHGRIQARRLTLAPPIARRAAAFHPAVHAALNRLPLLRTHLLCWIAKA